MSIEHKDTGGLSFGLHAHVVANADQFWSTTPEAFVHGTAASHDATGKLKFVWKAAQPTKNQGDKSVPDNLRTYFLWVQVQSAEDKVGDQEFKKQELTAFVRTSSKLPTAYFRTYDAYDKTKVDSVSVVRDFANPELTDSIDQETEELTSSLNVSDPSFLVRI